MGDVRQVLVPDIGDFKEVPVIELQVKPATGSRRKRRSSRLNPQGIDGGAIPVCRCCEERRD